MFSDGAGHRVRHGAYRPDGQGHAADVRDWQDVRQADDAHPVHGGGLPVRRARGAGRLPSSGAWERGQGAWQGRDAGVEAQRA